MLSLSGFPREDQVAECFEAQTWFGIKVCGGDHARDREFPPVFRRERPDEHTPATRLRGPALTIQKRKYLLLLMCAKQVCSRRTRSAVRFREQPDWRWVRQPRCLADRCNGEGGF